MSDFDKVFEDSEVEHGAHPEARPDLALKSDAPQMRSVVEPLLREIEADAHRHGYRATLGRHYDDGDAPTLRLEIATLLDQPHALDVEGSIVMVGDDHKVTAAAHRITPGEDHRRSFEKPYAEAEQAIRSALEFVLDVRHHHRH